MPPEPTLTQPQLTRRRLLLLFAAPLMILAVAWGTPLALRSQLGSRKPETAAKPVDGTVVFQQNCAQCHGANGDGRGSTILNPPARYFGRDKFKFASTNKNNYQECIPTDDDLMNIIHRGIPGSAMPSFAHISDEECKACIEQVRRFTRQGLYQRQVEKALKNEDDIEPAKFSKLAAEMSVPGKKLEIPRIPPSTPESVARGKLLYAATCAKCHGPEGKGDGPQVKDLKNDDGTPNFPRDLTTGQYKGGGEPEQLYARIMLGIPGTPMPSSSNQPQADIFDLIHFVQSLVKH